jgi:hypothetical protein
MLAIHLQRDINSAGFKPNWQVRCWVLNLGVLMQGGTEALFAVLQ